MSQPNAEMLALLEERVLWKARNKLADQYARPHPHPGGPYQWQREFHAAGKLNPERAIIAGNRVGKTRSAAAEIAIHATGLYPPWWTGRRFRDPVDAIVAEPTNELSRDIAQTELFGTIDSDGETRAPSGTGWVPFDKIGEFGFRQCGVPGVLDTVRVKHESGGWSTISLKSYEQGNTKFQGVSRDIVWLDEEPEDPMIFTESLMRILSKRGIMLFTRTPLFGATEVVRHFMGAPEGSGVWYKNVTWADAPHLDATERARMLQSVPEHEREARTMGVPMLGSGAVYACAQSLYTVEPFDIPRHWRRICGVDFGIDHPGSACWIAFDPDTDIVYVYDAYRMSGKTAAYHSDAIIQRGKWIPVAWPHDGMIRDKGGGETLADQYRAKGVYMLPMSARYDDDKGGGQAREPATVEILERMHTGRIKVFSHLTDLLEELRMLHRVEAKIVAERDDIESALRYAVMMLRFSLTKSEVETPRVSRCPDHDPFDVYARR